MPKITREAVKRETGDGACGPYEELRFSDSGGLTQFGAHEEILQPGSSSSTLHWHAEEDEMVYVLDGNVTLREGDTETPLTAGEAACFKAGVETGHCIENRSKAPARLLVIGTRAVRDRVHYPNHDRVQHVDRAHDERRWSNEAGAPADPLP
ncbi:cupin domain-containing protein [Pacificoceanicola onchidii]|uniref:cupin domain-containing protein n=1 Tax=Pacificoceanicola onchidii TaxID=2562685 RepID=UPI0010A35D79|nr:cupin domain-containing protein [Pacificoceanicola onchidii]